MTATVMVSIAQATDQPAPEADVGWWAGRAVLQSRCPDITNWSHKENHQLIKRGKRTEKSLEPWKSLSFLFEYAFPHFISHFEIYEHSLKWGKKANIRKGQERIILSYLSVYVNRRVKVPLCSQKSARNARSSLKLWLLFRTEPSENSCGR